MSTETTVALRVEPVSSFDRNNIRLDLSRSAALCSIVIESRNSMKDQWSARHICLVRIL